MARNLTSGMVTEVTATVLHPIILVKLEFPDGDLLLWTGYRDLLFNGDTYKGSGNLLTASAVRETSESRANGVTLQLSGIPASLISTALGQNYQNRPARIFLGVLDDNQAIVVDPYQIFKGRMDVMVIEDAGETATISLAIESVLASLERANKRRYTDEDHKLTFPNDTGFSRVIALQDAEVLWGVAS